MVKHDLGPDALIMSKRKVKDKGFLGFLKPAKIEVTAMLEEKKRNEERQFLIREDTSHSDLNVQLSDIKEMLYALVTEKHSSGDDPWKKFLIERDIAPTVAESIIDALIRDVKVLGEMTPERRKELLLKEISLRLATDSFTDEQIAFFVGPTGVGKTTTIAKIAAHKKLYMKKKVGLITVDTFRIGAVEQLKTYAQIIGVPFAVAKTRDDLENAIERMKDLDHILVDTMGRNHYNILRLTELKSFTEGIGGSKIFLVLSLSMKHQDLAAAVKNYRFVNYDSLILTKLDETEAYGSILNALIWAECPLCYITTGQNVPDDIEIASKDRLLQLILGEENELWTKRQS